MRQRILLPVLSLVALVAIAGCDTERTDPLAVNDHADVLADDGDTAEDQLRIAKVSDHGVPATARTYEITIENLTDDNGGGAAQVLSPPVIAVHGKGFSMWRKNQVASPELAYIAEDAIHQPMVDLLDASGDVHQSQVGGGLIFPGTEASYTIQTVHGARLLSIATMLVNTNDAFTGTSGLWLPWWGERTYYLRAFDAGSEENTELAGHVPGPCCGDTGQNGNATSDPIRPHPGLHGNGDIDPATYGWSGPVAKLTIRRLAPAYEVTLENLTPATGPGASQVFSPPVMATHDRRFRMWRRGHLASEELAYIAEDAISDPMLDLLDNSHLVSDVQIGGGVIPPGASETYDLEAPLNRRRLSMAFMLVNTNDAFSGASSLKLPRGGSVSYYIDAYDAGSEENTELEAHIPGPCCGDMGQNGNPTSERIRIHEGITGRGELDPATYDWDDPVGMLTVTRVQ